MVVSYPQRYDANKGMTLKALESFFLAYFSYLESENRYGVGPVLPLTNSTLPLMRKAKIKGGSSPTARIILALVDVKIDVEI